MMQVLGNIRVVIIFQYIWVSNQYFFYTLNLRNMTIQLYLSKAGIQNLYAHKKACIWMFVAALCIYARNKATIMSFDR